MNPAPRQHTPGPWYLNSRGWVVQSTGDIVTRLECSNNKEADARLIAAAPELIDALERISTAYDETLRHPIAAPLLQAIYGARAAIARATGGNAS